MAKAGREGQRRASPAVAVEVEGIEVGRFPLPPLPASSEPGESRQILNPAFLWGDSGRNLFWTEFSIIAPCIGDHDPEGMTKCIRAGIDSQNLDFVAEQDAPLEPISRMFFFCRDSGANDFGWDPDDLRDPETGKPAILEYPHGWRFVEEVASSFPEFLLDVLMLDRKKRDRPPDPRYEPDRRTQG